VQKAAVNAKIRFAWIDYAKAFGIVLVVLGHVNSGIAKTPGLTMGTALSLLNDIIYSVHMPLFFVLAGYVASLQCSQEPKSFARALLWGIAVPYAIWSVLWISLKASMPDVTANPVSITALLDIPFKPIAHMWFLYHLLFIRTGWYMLGRNTSSTQLAATAGAAALLSMILGACGPQWFSLSFFLQNFALYGFGMLAVLVVIPRISAWGLLQTAAIMAAGLAFAFWTRGTTLSPALPIMFGVTGAVAVIVATRALPEPHTTPFRLIAFTGEASLPIYVMHFFVTTPVRHLLVRLGALTEFNLLVVATVAGVCVPAAAYWFVLKLTSAAQLQLARYAGLGTARRSNYLMTESFGLGGRSLAAELRS
jgi:fucose 4-O-acetylase-like acetyltransferase